MNLDYILNRSKPQKNETNGVLRLMRLCSDLSFFSVEKAYNEASLKPNPNIITRLQFLESNELDLPNDLICSFLLFDAVKIGYLSREDIELYLYECCEDIITIDRVLYHAFMLASIEQVFEHRLNGLVQLKSLSILYELNILCQSAEDLYSKQYEESIRNFLKKVASVDNDIYTKTLQSQLF